MASQTGKAHTNTKGQTYVELPFQHQGTIHLTRQFLLKHLQQKIQ
jgi:hypothetical protein